MSGHVSIEDDLEEWTPLHRAVYFNKTECLNELILLGADVDQTDTNERTPLHHAAINGHVNVIEVLYKAGANIEPKDFQDYSPLHYASMYGHVNAIQVLIKAGADIKAKGFKGWSPLHHAATCNKIECLKELVLLGAYVNQADDVGQTPLHKSVICNWPESLAALILLGADVNQTDKQGQSPLFLAARCNKPSCLAELIRFEADINQADNIGQVPLDMAAYDGYVECVKMLIDAGADLNSVYNPLHECLLYGQEECAKLLRAAGATLKEEELLPMTTKEYKEKKKKDMLIFADKRNQEKVAKGLISVDKGLPWEVQSLDSSSAELFADLLAEDSYELYDTRYMLVGEKDVGKTTLADFLVGSPQKVKRQPTDGISLYNALAFLDRKTKEWRSGDQGFTLDQLIASRLLKVNPLSSNLQKTTLAHRTERKRAEYKDNLLPSIRQNTDVSLGNDGKLKTHTIGVHHEKPIYNYSLVGSTISFPKIDIAFHEDSLAGNSAKEGDASVSITNEQLIQGEKRKQIKSLEYVSASVTKKSYVHQTGDEEIGEHTIGNSTSKSYSFDNAPSYQNKSSKFQEVKGATDKYMSLSITKETLLAKSWAAGELKIHLNNLVPVLIWDLGGQDTFNATHPTFLTFRAIYMIVFNGSLPLDEPVKEYDRLPGMPRNRTSRDYLKFWVKTILTYNKGHDNGFPKLLFVATHKDKVVADKIENVRTTMYDDIDSMFSGGISQHLVTNHRLFVNAVDRFDPEMSKLKEVLAEMSFMQPTWGEKMPSCFLPLEMELASQVAKGVKIISYDDLYELNQAMPIRPLTKKELDLFLSVQHAIGKLLYFSVQRLNEKIILTPTHLIDAFRSIVTDRQFCATDGRLQSWNKMAIDGVLKKSTLEQIWQQPEFSHFWCDREYLISLMTHLDILSEPRRYDKNGCLLTSDFFLVPSMVRKKNETSYFEVSDFDKRAICLSFTSLGEILPPALCYRFITYCLSLWPVKKYGDMIEDSMLFEDEAVLVIDNSLDLSIHCGEDRILVRLVHEESNSLIVEDVATAIRECLETTLNNITRLYQQFFANRRETRETNFQSTFELKPCCASAHSPCIVDDMTQLETAEKWKCPGHGIVHSRRSLLAWFVPKGKRECLPENTCANENFLSQRPSDLHLRRLSLQLNETQMHEIFICLRNSQVEWDDIKSNQKDIENVKFLCLLKWRDGADSGTFTDLKKCLESTEVSPHNLCQVLRERYIDFADPELGKVPSDEDIDKLAPLIGLQSIHFLVELGLTFQTWEEIVYGCGTDLVKTNRRIINTWKEKCELESGVKPTIRIICQAFVNIGKSKSTVEQQLKKKNVQRKR